MSGMFVVVLASTPEALLLRGCGTAPKPPTSAPTPPTPPPTPPTPTLPCNGSCASPADADDCAACCGDGTDATYCCVTWAESKGGSRAAFDACMRYVGRRWPLSLAPLTWPGDQQGVWSELWVPGDEDPALNPLYP